MKQKGFTLIELMTVISIIALLASVVLGNLNAARARAVLSTNVQFEANTLHGIGDQLVGEWKFNDGAGTAVDTSSYHNNGTPGGGITYLPTGGYDGNGAFSFDGINDNITLGVPSILNFNGISAFTDAAWVNPTSVSGTRTIIGRHSAGTNAMGTLRLSGGRLELIITTASGLVVPVPSSIGTVPVNKWTYVAVSYDGTYAYFYINGKLDAKVATAGSGPLSASYTTAYIGQSGAGELFVGMIDTVRIYTSIVVASEMARTYALEKPSHMDGLAVK